MIFQVLDAQNLYDVADISDDLKVNAHSIVRKDHITINVPEQNELEYSRHMVITVLDKFGNDHRDRFISYDKSRKLKKLKVNVYDKDGEEIESFKGREFLDASAVEGGTLYSDNRVKFIPFTPEDYPYTIEYEYTIETANTIFFPTWYLFTNYNSSIESKSLTINYDRSLGFRKKVFDPNNILNINENGGSFYVVVNNLNPLFFEPYSPDWDEISPNIKFATDKFHLEGINGEAKTWKEFGKWEYDYLIGGLDQLPQQTIEKVTNLVSHAENEREIVKIIYEYVQKNTRYISVQLGIGGLRPYPASEVDELGYGDCKGLSNYTKALLKSQGIESYYTEVWSGSSKRDIDKDFHSIQGNHVILNVPLEDQDIWLECTSQTMPFNFLGDFTDDRDVLLLTPEGGVFKRTPEYNGDENKITTVAHSIINSSGSIESNLEISSTGIHYDRRYKLESLEYKDQDQFYKNYWDYVNNISIKSIELMNNKDQVLFNEKINLIANSYLNKAGSKLIVPLNTFQRFTSKPAIDKNRQLPVVFNREVVYQDEHTMTIPDGYGIESMPEQIELDTDYGYYSTSVEVISENNIKFKRTFRLNQGKHNPEKFQEFRDFIRKVNRGDKQKMILIKS